MMDLLQWFFSSHFSCKIFWEVFVDVSESRLQSMFWSAKSALCSGLLVQEGSRYRRRQGLSSFFPRRANGAARVFFFGVVSTPGFAGVVFLGKQQWNRMMFAMIWRYYMIIRDKLWCNVMKFEIWCDVMLWDWKWFDMMSEVYTVCVWSWQTTNIPVLTTTVLWQGHLVFWHNFGFGNVYFPWHTRLPNGR